MNFNQEYIVNSEAQLESIIGQPMDVRAKILPALDEVMREFISRSPLVFISTIDANGHIDISPKGDPVGFVKIDDLGNLLIPDRLGNRLVMGFRNLLKNPEIGLIFVIPNQRETLRVKGLATLLRDPQLLDQLQANGKPALLCTYVDVKECFIHCGKAMVRSKMWNPESWNSQTHSLGAKQLASVFGINSTDPIKQTEDLLENAYKHELY